MSPFKIGQSQAQGNCLAIKSSLAFDSRRYSVRPDGAYHQWRKIPPRELLIDLVADERFVWATERAEAS
jgi:hypothetical protein